MSMFKFDEKDTRIFPYSKGERDEQGQFKTVYGDPAAIERALLICLPNRNPMVDQYLAGDQLMRRKHREAQAYDANPEGYMLGLVTSAHAYQAQIVDHAAPGGTRPNPETPAAYAKRLGVPIPPELTPEEEAIVKFGEIAHQNLCLGFRKAFDLLPFDETTGKGCTDAMVMHVMTEYSDWLKKNAGSTPATPTSSPPSPAA